MCNKPIPKDCDQNASTEIEKRSGAFDEQEVEEFYYDRIMDDELFYFDDDDIDAFEF